MIRQCLLGAAMLLCGFAALAAGSVASRRRAATFPAQIAGLEPAARAVLRQSSVLVSGDCGGAVSVSVSGVPARVYGSRFAAENVPLSEGRNELVISAQDAAGNSTTWTHTLIRDTSPPRLSISAPANGVLTGNASITVVGTASDEHLASVEVQGAVAELKGSSFQHGGVPLVEGPNLLRVVARDEAGNLVEARVEVVRDSTAPILRITSPAEGSRSAAASVDVEGTVSDSHLQNVRVNGIAATVAGGSFRARGVRLAAGTNALTAIAADRAGNVSRYSVAVVRDPAALTIRVDSPSPGLRTAVESISVSGSVAESLGAAVSVNGVEAKTSKGRFGVDGVPLQEGANTLTVRAAGSGREGVFRTIVFRDTVAPKVISFSPPAGTTGIPPAAVVRIVFSEPLAPETVSSSSVALVADGGGGSVPFSVFLNEREISVVPLESLAEQTAYRVAISAGVADLAGKRLEDLARTRFVTGSSRAAATPLLDPLPASLCASSLNVTGSADPGARVRVFGGAAIVTAVADSAGRFSAAVPLHGNALNALRAAALDPRERPSPPAFAVLRADCAPPSVESARLEGDDLVVRFSEPIDPATLAREGAVTLTGPKGETQIPLRLDPDGITARSSGLAGLSGHVWTVHVRSGVADTAGNRLVAPFAASLLTAGESGLIGEVFDDRTGRPLPGAAITVVAINGTAPAPPAPTTTTDSDGQFSLVVPAGEVVFSASRDGYAAVTRTENAPSTEAVVAFDARLTPLASVTARADGGADIADANLLFALPAGSLSAGTTIHAAALSCQGVPILAPLGWTAAAALSLDTAPASLAMAASASWKNGLGLPAGTALLLARYDAAARRYLAVGPASLSTDASRILATVSSSGAFVVFAADPAPNAPPQPAAGQPLAGVAAPSADPILTASVTTDPSAVLPTETAKVTATLAVSAPVPSGSPVEVLISETLTLLNGQQIQSPSFLADLTVVRDGAGRAVVPFRIHPSATAAQVALSVGFEDLTVKRYSYDLRRGDLVGASGGTVAGASGFSLTVPPNALTQTVPVKLTPVASAADLGIPVPAGYRFLAGLQITLGGKNLAAPATLSWSSAADPTGGGMVWAEVAEWNGLLRVRFVAQARYNAASAAVVTAPIDPAVLPAPGVLRGGLYVLLGSNSPLAYVKGRVLDVPGTPLASVVVTEDGTSLVAISDAAGTFALPAPASGATIRSIRVDTGNTGQATVPAQAAVAVASADIRLSVAAPYVLSVSPATASPLPLDLPVVFTLSEPLNPATVGSASVSAVSGAAVIGGTVRLSNSGTQVTFTPDGSWPGKATVRLTLSSTVTDLQGYRLVDRTTQVTGDYVATYTTVDPTPPSDINPLLISMGFPSGTPPVVSISGAPGAACGSCNVIAVNETTGVTSATTSGADGSFSLTVPATATDRVSLTMQRPGGGGDIRVDPGPFKNDGGRTAYVGTRAADYLTRDGIRVTLDDGAFAGPVTLIVKPIPQSALPAPAPPLATFIAGIEIDPGDAVAGKPVDLAVAAPAGVTGGQFLVARAVEILGETRWMVVDTARYENGAITTRPAVGTQSQSSVVRLAGAARAAGLALAQDCPQLTQPGGSKSILDRVIRKSNLIILGVEQQLAFLASSVISPNVAASVLFSGQYSYLADLLPFVWIARESKQQCYFALPVPVGVPYTLLGRDATTGLTIFQAALPAITDPANVTVLPADVLAGNLPAPRIVSGSPFTVSTFVPVPTASGSDERSLLPKIHYAFAVSTGQVVINGDPGAVEACAHDSSNVCTGFVELSLVNNSRAAAAAVATARADGSFGPLSVAATSGDDMTFIAGTDSLAPDAKMRLVFTQMLVPSALKADLALKDGATALAFDLLPDSGGDAGSRGFTATPSVSFARGHSISLTLAGGSGNRVPAPLTFRMSSPSSDLIGGRDVKNVNALYLKGGLLLEVTGDGGNVGDGTGAPKLNLYDASDPASLTLCASLSLDDFARAVTMDGHDRVLVAMGGGGTNGRVQVFRLTAPAADRAGPCAGRRLAGEGDIVAGKSLDRAWTEVTVRAGAGDLGVLPEGFPRRLEILARETRDVIVLDQQTTLPTFVTELRRTDLLPAGGDGKQDPDSPLTVVGMIPANPGDSFPSPLNQPATVTNLTTGASWTAYADASGNFTIAARASSGDRLEFRVNAADLAIAGTEGFGIQGVEINRTVHFDTDDCTPGSGGSNDPCEAGKRLLFSFGRIGDLTSLCRTRDGGGNCVDAFRTLEGLNDLALLPAATADAPGDPPDPTAIALVNRFGLATFSLAGSGSQVQINQLGPGIPLATFASPAEFPLMFAVQAARGFPVKPAAQLSYCSRDFWTGYRPTLAFAATARGVFVVDVTKARVPNPSDPPDASPYPAPRLIGFFSIAAGANTLALDSKRGILYVGLSAPSAGVAAYDMTDPCTLGLENHTAGENDPRRIAFIATPSQNVNVPFALDADTGLIFGASDADTSGTGRAFALSLFAPPIRFVADTNRDGIWEDVAEGIPLGVWNPGKSAPPYRPDVVRVLANIFGGAGKELVVELSSASTGGFTLSELRAGFPRTRTYVTLTRESDDPAEFGYNRYLSPPIVLIADPRARKDYAIKDKPQEREDGAADASKDYACRNCLVASGYAAELALYAADTDGVTPGTPAKKAIEQWAGEKLIVRLAWDTASESALKIKATYLAGLDLQRVNASIKTTRGDLTPTLQQVPVQNASLFTTEAGVAVDTHAGGARMAWTDLSIKGRGLDFVLSRYYVSDILNAGPFGRNEDSPLFARLRDLPTGDVDFYSGDGSRHTFRFVPGANGVGAHFQAPKGVFLDLYRKPDLTFLLVYPEQTRLFFDESGRLTPTTETAV
jgi:hypothetical protein